MSKLSRFALTLTVHIDSSPASASSLIYLLIKWNVEVKLYKKK